MATQRKPAHKAAIKKATKEIARTSGVANKRSIFDTPKARGLANAFTKVTHEPTDYQGVFGRMFEVVLAKQKLAANGPQTPKELDVDEIRAHLFTVIGDAGWERALFFFAQCARLWAELPGPVEFSGGQRELMHAVSGALSNLMMDGRAIDRASKGRP